MHSEFHPNLNVQICKYQYIASDQAHTIKMINSIVLNEYCNVQTHKLPKKSTCASIPSNQNHKCIIIWSLDSLFESTKYQCPRNITLSSSRENLDHGIENAHRESVRRLLLNPDDQIKHEFRIGSEPIKNRLEQSRTQFDSGPVQGDGPGGKLGFARLRWR